MYVLYSINTVCNKLEAQGRRRFARKQNTMSVRVFEDDVGRLQDSIDAFALQIFEAVRQITTASEIPQVYSFGSGFRFIVIVFYA